MLTSGLLDTILHHNSSANSPANAGVRSVREIPRYNSHFAESAQESVFLNRRSAVLPRPAVSPRDEGSLRENLPEGTREGRGESEEGRVMSGRLSVRSLSKC